MKQRTFLMKLGIFLAWLSMAHTAVAGTSEDARDAFAMLTLGPKPNVVKDCMVSALELNMGLGLMVIGHGGIDDVRKALLDGVVDKDQQKRLEALIEDWQRDRNPSKAASTRFQHCINDQGISFDLDASCFSVAGVAVRAEAHKFFNLPRHEAVTKTQRSYSNSLPEDFVKKTVEAVYDYDAKGSQYLAHRRAFIECFLSQRSNR